MERGVRNAEKVFGWGDFRASNFLQDFIVSIKRYTTAMETNLPGIQ